MRNSPATRFALTVFVTLMVVFPVSAIISPPDIDTQLVVAGILTILILPVAYYVIYKEGYESILRS